MSSNRLSLPRRSPLPPVVLAGADAAASHPLEAGAEAGALRRTRQAAIGRVSLGRRIFADRPVIRRVHVIVTSSRG
jgi:hypothetical protein